MTATVLVGLSSCLSPISWLTWMIHFSPATASRNKVALRVPRSPAAMFDTVVDDFSPFAGTKLTLNEFGSGAGFSARQVVIQNSAISCRKYFFTVVRSTSAGFICKTIQAIREGGCD